MAKTEKAKTKETKSKEKVVKTVTKDEVTNKETESVSAVEENVKTETKARSKSVRIPRDEEFAVISNVIGSLYFASRSGDLILDFAEFGDREYVTYEELNKMKNQSRTFFKENWVVIEGNDDYTDGDVYKALRVDQYYQNYLTSEDIDDFFNLSAEEIKEKLQLYTDGMKETIKTKAKMLIDDHSISDMSVIKVLQDTLNADFGVEM